MPTGIAIIGMACRFPGARSYQELWENVLAQRREFRRIPPERLRVEDYAPGRGADDSIYCDTAAVLDDYAFDRARFHVSGEAFRSADLAHWLALDVAAAAIGDASLDMGDASARERTGVYIGNTLTGDISRAQVMRLRWPYVRRSCDAVFRDAFADPAAYASRLTALERQYKSAFAPCTEESLAGGLSNTIAGRICNHFDLQGAGYTIDGACASSLLAIATACSALAAGDVDAAIAGGVDLSLDPFELAGFSRLGALAREAMRVYDARSEGFWPGEGCGIVVLMREADAGARGLRAHAVIRGWGVSSDGGGGLTRPEQKGQLLALERAYARAQYGIDTVAYFEGHGTGTTVGDATELQALIAARRRAQRPAPPAAIGSIKANIGHTKAAAGAAGLIKAALAVERQIIPPTTGCDEPHALLGGADAPIRVARQGEIWPDGPFVRAGVSGMGFGGVDAHVTLEAAGTERRRSLRASERRQLCSAQDAELFLLGAPSARELATAIDGLRGIAARLAESEMADLSASLARAVLAGGGRERGGVRAAVVAGRRQELASALARLQEWLEAGVTARFDAGAGVFLGSATSAPRIGYLFSGQASPVRRNGGLWARRFPAVAALYGRERVPEGPSTSTAVAQPAIVAASIGALAVLDEIGLEASVAVGHSLGELTALHWSGVVGEEAVLRIARARGEAMERHGDPAGAMASLAVAAAAAASILRDEPVTVAAVNAPTQIVISGSAAAVERAIARARARGAQAARLPVSRAFHSPLVAHSAAPLAGCLDGERLAPSRRRVVSTVTGVDLPPDCDVRGLLSRQIVSPVRFQEAIERASAGLDLWIEVGPGAVLAGLAAECTRVPAIATDASGESIRGLLCASAASFALGAAIDAEALFGTRFVRPFDPATPKRFLTNPCESAPVSEAPPAPEPALPAPEPVARPAAGTVERAGDAAPNVREALRRVIGARTELALDAIHDGLLLLGDLHLNSITVSQIIAETARQLGCAVPASPADYSTVAVRDAAAALEEMLARGPAPVEPGAPQGIDTWVRCFTDDWIEAPQPAGPPHHGPGAWRLVAAPGDALARTLERTLAAGGAGSDLLVCVPPETGEASVPVLLAAARAALDSPGGRVVVVQRGGGAAPFFRSLYLELLPPALCIVDLPDDSIASAEWAAAEARLARGYSEVRYDRDGIRREPRLRLAPIEESPPVAAPFGPDDVLLVSGGGKGIGMECALALARRYGVGVALLGRSDPAADEELARGLERFRTADVRFGYFRADVTDAGAVAAAAGDAASSLGPITAVLHAAGWNQPRRLQTLDEAAFGRTLRPKVAGLRNLLRALDGRPPRLLVTFGSLIARTGIPGEADYAVANDWMGRLAEEWASASPGRRFLHLDWSVWAGTGMGQRLGAIEGLMRQGITPIPLDKGIATLEAILETNVSGRLVVASRFGNPPTAPLASASLPLRRFLEEPRVHYPGVELVADFELSDLSDPYLDEHIVQGEKLLPAVLGLEAMAQAATALVGREDLPVFDDVQLWRPIVVGPGAPLRVRVAALRRHALAVDVALRTEATNFSADHFRATCRFDEAARVPTAPPAAAPPRGARLAIDPGRDLYGSLLVHGGRFRRIRAYEHLRARECVAEIASSQGPWFARHLPGDLLLGDPGARDAAIHAVQACIPHTLLLPAGIERIRPSGVWPERVFVHARERTQAGKEFVYDLDVRGEDGRLIEQWEGLRLVAVAPSGVGATWPEPLLGPYLERRLAELVPESDVEIAIEASASRESRRATAIRRVVPPSSRVMRRDDGKPEIAGAGRSLSIAHGGRVTMAACSAGPLGCDVEIVRPRSNETWGDLLGDERRRLAELVARESGDSFDTAATRVWVVHEALRKAGACVNGPLLLSSARPDGWVLFSAGHFTGATVSATGASEDAPLVLGVMFRSQHEVVRIPACGGV